MNLDDYRDAIAKRLVTVANTIGYSVSEFTAQKTVNSLIGNDFLMGFGKRKRKVRKAKGKGFQNV